VGLPGGEAGRIGPIWFETLPWLKEAYLFQFGRKPSEEFLRRLGILAQTRNFPPPELNEQRFVKEFRAWKADLTRKVQLDPDLVLGFRRAGSAIADHIHNLDFPVRPRPHISLSASACYDTTRKQGGRSIDFLRGWIKHYVTTHANEEVHDETWFGAPYITRPGIPKAYTMCRVQPLDERIEDFLTSAYRDEMGANTYLEALFSGAMSHHQLEEPVFGLDQELPLQMLQYSIEASIEAGYFQGKPYGQLARIRATDKRIIARAHPVCEPGNKVRWVTMEQSFVTVFLQPLAHWLAGILSCYPALKSAFTRS
jgi:hypothetical protein